MWPAWPYLDNKNNIDSNSNSNSAIVVAIVVAIVIAIVIAMIVAKAILMVVVFENGKRSESLITIGSAAALAKSRIQVLKIRAKPHTHEVTPKGMDHLIHLLIQQLLAKKKLHAPISCKPPGLPPGNLPGFQLHRLRVYDLWAWATGFK